MVHVERCQSLATCLESLDEGKLVEVDVHRCTSGILATEVQHDVRSRLVGEHFERGGLVFADEVLARLRRFQHETLGVEIAVVVGIAHHGAPDLLRIELLDTQDVVLVVVVYVEVGAVVVAVFQDDKNLILVEELAQQYAMVVIIQAVDVGIPPHLQSAQGAMSEALQRDAVDRVLGQDVALGASSLDGDVGEGAFHEEFLVLAARLQDGVEGYLDDFGLAVGVGGEVEHLRTRLSLRQIDLAVARDGRHVESLDVACASLTVTIDHVICGS